YISTENNDRLITVSWRACYIARASANHVGHHRKLKVRYSKSRVAYDNNCLSTFQVKLNTLSLSGDIHTNPGPESTASPSTARNPSTDDVNQNGDGHSSASADRSSSCYLGHSFVCYSLTDLHLLRSNYALQPGVAHIINSLGINVRLQQRRRGRRAGQHVQRKMAAWTAMNGRHIESVGTMNRGSSQPVRSTTSIPAPAPVRLSRRRPPTTTCTKLHVVPLRQRLQWTVALPSHVGGLTASLARRPTVQSKHQPLYRPCPAVAWIPHRPLLCLQT